MQPGKCVSTLRDVTRHISHDNIINKFGALKNRRIKFIF